MKEKSKNPIMVALKAPQPLQELKTILAKWQKGYANHYVVTDIGNLVHQLLKTTRLDQKVLENISIGLKVLQKVSEEQTEFSHIGKIIGELFRQYMTMLDSKITNCDKLLDEVLDTILFISEVSSAGKSAMLTSLAEDILRAVTSSPISWIVAMEILKVFNLLLERCAAVSRDKINASATVTSLSYSLAQKLRSIGDYEFQVGMTECLFRITKKSERSNKAASWFTSPQHLEAFKQIRDSEFETDCREFLNTVNSTQKDKQLVFSYPATSVHLGQLELHKPDDPEYTKFWVDFNCGSGRITLFCNQELNEQDEESLWETVSMDTKIINTCHMEEIGGQTVLRILLMHSSRQLIRFGEPFEDNTVTMKFSADLQVARGLRKLMEDKVTGSSSTGKAVKRKASVCSTPVKVVMQEVRDMDESQHSRISDEELNMDLSTRLSEKRSRSLNISEGDQSVDRVKVDTTNPPPVHKRKVSVPSHPMMSPSHLTHKPAKVANSEALKTPKSKTPKREKTPLVMATVPTTPSHTGRVVHASIPTEKMTVSSRQLAREEMSKEGHLVVEKGQDVTCVPDSQAEECSGNVQKNRNSKVIGSSEPEKKAKCVQMAALKDRVDKADPNFQGYDKHRLKYLASPSLSHVTEESGKSSSLRSIKQAVGGRQSKDGDGAEKVALVGTVDVTESAGPVSKTMKCVAESQKGKSRVKKTAGIAVITDRVLRSRSGSQENCIRDENVRVDHCVELAVEQEQPTGKRGTKPEDKKSKKENQAKREKTKKERQKGDSGKDFGRRKIIDEDMEHSKGKSNSRCGSKIVHDSLEGCRGRGGSEEVCEMVSECFGKTGSKKASAAIDKEVGCVSVDVAVGKVQSHSSSEQNKKFRCNSSAVVEEEMVVGVDCDADLFKKPQSRRKGYPTRSREFAPSSADQNRGKDSLAQSRNPSSTSQPGACSGLGLQKDAVNVGTGCEKAEKKIELPRELPKVDKVLDYSITNAPNDKGLKHAKPEESLKDRSALSGIDSDASREAPRGNLFLNTSKTSRKTFEQRIADASSRYSQPKSHLSSQPKFFKSRAMLVLSPSSRVDDDGDCYIFHDTEGVTSPVKRYSLEEDGGGKKLNEGKSTSRSDKKSHGMQQSSDVNQQKKNKKPCTNSVGYSMKTTLAKIEAKLAEATNKVKKRKVCAEDVIDEFRSEEAAQCHTAGNNHGNDQTGDDKEPADENVSKFAQVCQSLVSASAKKLSGRSKRQRRAVNYKEISVSDIDVNEDLDSSDVRSNKNTQPAEQVKCKKKARKKGPFDDTEDNLSSLLESRSAASEVSWLKSGCKNRRKADKQYHHASKKQKIQRGLVTDVDNSPISIIGDVLEREVAMSPVSTDTGSHKTPRLTKSPYNETDYGELYIKGNTPASRSSCESKSSTKVNRSRSDGRSCKSLGSPVRTPASKRRYNALNVQITPAGQQQRPLKGTSGHTPVTPRKRLSCEMEKKSSYTPSLKPFVEDIEHLRTNFTEEKQEDFVRGGEEVVIAEDITELVLSTVSPMSSFSHFSNTTTPRCFSSTGKQNRDQDQPIISLEDAVVLNFEDISFSSSVKKHDAKHATSGPASAVRTGQVVSRIAAYDGDDDDNNDDDDDSDDGDCANGDSVLKDCGSHRGLSSANPNLQPRQLFADANNRDRATRRSCVESVSVSSADTSVEAEATMGFNNPAAMMKAYSSDYQQYMMEQKQNLEMLTVTFMRNTSKQISHVWATQENSSAGSHKMVFATNSNNHGFNETASFTNIKVIAKSIRQQNIDAFNAEILQDLRELEKDVEQLNEAEDRMTAFFKEQLKVLRAVSLSQTRKLKKIQDKSLNWSHSLQNKRKTKPLQDIILHELRAFKGKVIADMQKREMNHMKRSLQALFM